jgi:sugar/nucleoside kinase (ribokinase family)
MRANILSNLVVDEIVSLNNISSQSLGGPAAYCGLTARKFGFDTTLFTHFGKDLDSKYLEYLKKHGIIFNSSEYSELPTTRFVLRNFEDDRELTLNSICSAIDIEEIKNVKSDCWIISPVFEEVSVELLRYLATTSEKGFVILDPQGYTRAVDSARKISLRNKIDVPLNDLNGIKLDSHEISSLTNGLSGKDGLRKIRSKYGIDYVIYTQDQNIHLLQDDRLYWLNIPKIDSPDSTGLGDIITASFACTIVKEKEAIWALCFAAGALTSALQTREIGIEKIPSKSAIEENAAYYYNIMNYDTI